LQRAYWAFAILLVVAIFAIPITFAIRNPDVRIPMTHGPPPRELVRDWELAVTQLRREQTRLEDFAFAVNHLWDSYPFIEMLEARGVDFFGLALEAFHELEEIAAYEIGHWFLAEFIEDRFLSHLGGYGGVHLTGDGRGLGDWLLQPYFFGLHDSRFTDDRIETEVRGENFYARREGEVGYVTINRFLPKGYEDVTRIPFWYFDFEEEWRQLLRAYVGFVTVGVERIVIDIRGIGSGFGDYFVPLVLEPLINEPVSVRGYGFHSDSPFSRRVSAAFREWYGFTDRLSPAASLAATFDYAIPHNLVHGFAMEVMALPLQLSIPQLPRGYVLGGERISAGFGPISTMSFDGEVWLLTDSANFSGHNFLYMQMAADAGFVIFYEENPDAQGWEYSLVRLPNSGVSLRYNPIYFTDVAGRPFEGVRPAEWVE